MGTKFRYPVKCFLFRAFNVPGCASCGQVGGQGCILEGVSGPLCLDGNSVYFLFCVGEKSMWLTGKLLRMEGSYRAGSFYSGIVRVGISWL